MLYSFERVNRQVDREVFWNLKETLYSSDICLYWTIHMLSCQIMCPECLLLFIFWCVRFLYLTACCLGTACYSCNCVQLCPSAPSPAPRRRRRSSRPSSPERGRGSPWPAPPSAWGSGRRPCRSSWLRLGARRLSQQMEHRRVLRRRRSRVPAFCPGRVWRPSPAS